MWQKQISKYKSGKETCFSAQPLTMDRNAPETATFAWRTLACAASPVVIAAPSLVDFLDLCTWSLNDKAPRTTPSKCHRRISIPPAPMLDLLAEICATCSFALSVHRPLKASANDWPLPAIGVVALAFCKRLALWHWPPPAAGSPSNASKSQSDSELSMAAG